jgi:hypothetical protein
MREMRLMRSHPPFSGQNQWLLVGSVVDSSSQETEATTTIDLATGTPGQGLEIASKSNTDGDANIGHPLGPHAVFVTLAQSNFTRKFTPIFCFR